MLSPALRLMLVGHWAQIMKDTVRQRERERGESIDHVFDPNSSQMWKLMFYFPSEKQITKTSGGSFNPWREG